MEKYLTIIDYVVIGLMLLASASIGLYFRFTGGRQRTMDEFLMARRSMSVWPVAFSLMATYISGATMLGVPVETYMYGSQFLLWVFSLPVGFVIVAYGIIPVFYNSQSITVNEYLEKRFGSFMRVTASLLFAIQVVLYTSVVIYAPAIALQAVSGISLWTTVISLAIVCTFYCSIGGLKAVLWTDLFQASLMCITMIAVGTKLTFDFGGSKKIFNLAEEGGRLILLNTSTDFSERYTLWNCIIGGITFSIAVLGTNQAQVQRLMSVGTIKKAQMSLLISLPLLIIFNASAIWNGIIMYAMYYKCDPLLSKMLTSRDQLFPSAMLQTFSGYPGLPGLFIAGIFSASLSSASSALNSLTAVIMEDFIKRYFFCKCLTESRSALIAKIIALLLGALCLLMTYIVSNFRGIYEAAFLLNSLMIGPLSGVFILGMMTTRTNQLGASIGLLFGLTTSIVISFGSYINKPKIPSLIRSVENCTVLRSNSSSINSNETMNTIIMNGSNILENTLSNNMDERYIFPLFKISYIWIPCFGFIIVIVIGYVTSILINIFKENPHQKIELISPLLQRWYFKKSHTNNHPNHKFKLIRANVEELELPENF